jgi:hypothetical protein
MQTQCILPINYVIELIMDLKNVVTQKDMVLEILQLYGIVINMFKKIQYMQV